MTTDERHIEVRDKRNGDWFWIDDEIISVYGPQIGPYGIAMYANLAWRSKYATSKAYPSLKTLAHETGMSRNMAWRTVHKLRDVGLISIVPRAAKPGSKERDSSLYTLLPVKKERRGITPQGTPRTTTGDTRIPPGVTEQDCSEQETATTVTATPAPKYGAAAAAALTASQAETLVRLKQHGVARNHKVLALVRDIADRPDALEAVDALAAAIKRNKRIENMPGALVAALEAYDWNAKPAKAARIVARFEE